MYYKSHKIHFKRGGPYIDSPDWITKKKATMNPMNKEDNKCFQYIVTTTTNHDEWGRIAQSCGKKLNALLSGITTKIHVHFYYLNCLYSFATKNELESDNKVCRNKDFGNIAMLSEDTKILGFNQYQQSDKAPFIVYSDSKWLIEKD